MRLTKSILAWALTTAMAACGSDSPSAPQIGGGPTPPPSLTPVIAMFNEPATGLSTADVRDVHGQIVRFDTANNALIWAADGRSFPGYPVVDGAFIRSDKHFQVRFGTQDGQRRAYFTETATGTICDIEVAGTTVVITATSVAVPTA